MTSRTRFCHLLLLGVVLLAPLAARAETEQQVVVDRASRTIADLTRDKAFGNARQLLHQARAILIIPRLFKGGFIVGGEGGTGVLLVRGRENSWSDPAFYAIGSASFGLQAGLAQSEAVLLVMTQRGLDALLRDQFKFGAQAGIAVANLGSGVEGAVSSGGPDIVVWSSSSGVYAGIALDGSIIRAQPEDNRAYYGRPLTTRGVLFGPAALEPHATVLRRELASIQQFSFWHFRRLSYGSDDARQPMNVLVRAPSGRSRWRLGEGQRLHQVVPRREDEEADDGRQVVEEPGA
jgi:lipid-binding SYLF domain-containing protein